MFHQGRTQEDLAELLMKRASHDSPLSPAEHAQTLENYFPNARMQAVDPDEFMEMPGQQFYRGVARPEHVEPNLNAEFIGDGILGSGHYLASHPSHAWRYAACILALGK